MGMREQELYLRGALFVLRTRLGHYGLIHLGSGTATPTDALGAWAARQLILGRSIREVGAELARRAPEAANRYELFVAVLNQFGALDTKAPRSRLRWRRRMLVSLTLGPLLTLVSLLIPYLSVEMLARLWKAVPRFPLARKNLGQTQAYIDASLRSAGYDDMPAAWRISVAAETCAAGVQNSFFGYLCFVLPQDKLAHLVDRLIHAESFAALERQLRQASGGIVATIHSDAYFIISVYLALRGHRVSLLANMKTAGVPLKDDPDFYKSYPRGFEDLIDSSTEDARAQLLDRLHAGRVVVIVFDAPKQREVAGVEQPVTQFLGRTVRCFFGPGWLAAHDNLPVVFVASYRANARIALDGPEVLYPEPALSTYEQTAAITRRLYALAERFIRAHPSAWLGWSYLDAFDMKRTQVPAHA